MKTLKLALLLLILYTAEALAGTYTPNLNLYMPVPNLEKNWGAASNDNFVILDTTVGRLNSVYVDSRTYGTGTQANLAAADAAAVAVGRPLYITQNYLISSGSTTLSSNWRILPGGKFTISGTGKINFSAAPTELPGNFQWIFNPLPGAVTFAMGSVEKINALWFGADPTFATDSGVSIQAAINSAAGVAPAVVPCGHYKHASPIYLNYDSTLNPGFPSDPYKNILTIEGCLVGGRAQADDSIYIGTVIEYTGSSGAGIVRDKCSTCNGYEGTNFNISKMGFRSSAPDYALSLKWTHSHSSLEDIFVQQTNILGSLVNLQETYMVTGRRIFLYGPAYPAKAQTGLRIYNEAAGGGMFTFNMITTRNTNTGYDIGGHTYNDGIANYIQNIEMKNAQAGDCNIGLFAGWKVQSGNINLYTESTGTVQSSVILDQQPLNITLRGGRLAAITSGPQVYAGQAVGANIENNLIYVTDSSLASGVTLSSAAGADTYRVSKNTFWPLTTPHTSTIGIDLEGTHGDTRISPDNVYVGLDTKVKNLQYANPTVQSITVTASPFTYSNSTMMPMDVTVQGGTVTSIAVSRRGTSVTTGSTNGMFRLDPLDALVTTYTGTPTMKYWNHSY